MAELHDGHPGGITRRSTVEQYWHLSQQRNWAVPAVREFRDDDVGYAAWLDATPDGCVLNIERSYNPTGARLHRARCRTLTDQISRGAVLTGQYVKICAEHRKELEQWVADQVGQLCGVGPVTETDSMCISFQLHSRYYPGRQRRHHCPREGRCFADR